MLRRQVKTSRTIGTVLVLALLVAAVCSATAIGQGKTKVRPLYWGAWIGTQIDGTQAPYEMSSVSKLEAKVGKGLSLIEFSMPFADCGHGPCSFYEFPTPAMENARTYGAIPFLSWGSQFTPWNVGEPGANANNISLAAVAKGRYDSYIRSFAQAAAKWGHPFFLRYDWEMNGTWFPWGNTVGGNKPKKFVAAWRHVHRIFTAAGATNANWVWCPYAEGKPDAKTLRALYPGGKFVDWTCLDGYNWGKNKAKPRPWHSFDEIFGPTYKLITQKIARGKPMVLGELASNSRGGNKAQWIAQMMSDLPSKYPLVRGLIWFDVVDRGIDWPLETSAAALKAFSKGIKSPSLGFVGNEFSALAGGPIRPPR